MAFSFLFSPLGVRAVGNETQQQHQYLDLLLVITLVIALIARPLRLPYTLILVVVGLLIGFSPLLPDLHLNPDVVLFLFLPALLFEGAWNVAIRQLLANWLAVFLLAVPGLLLSVLVVAALLHFGLQLSWLLALLLGAMILPDRSDCGSRPLASTRPLGSSADHCGRGEPVQRWRGSGCL